MSITALRPISERITEEIKRRLKLLVAGLEVPSPVVEVVRSRRIGDYTPKHQQIVLSMGDAERAPEMGCPGNPPGVAHRQRFNIRCHLMPSEKDPTPIDEYANVLEADVILALTSVGSSWYTMGSLAINSEVMPREDIAADGGVDGFNLPLDVWYRVSELDPYSVR